MCFILCGFSPKNGNIDHSQSQEGEDQSHVHFSLDTSYKVKCEVSKMNIHYSYVFSWVYI